MRKVELWGRPGGPVGRVPNRLGKAVKELIREFGPEAVAQVAVLESHVLPVDEPVR